MSQLVSAQQLSLKHSAYSVTYKFHSPLFIKNNFFRKKLSKREYFCAFILCQRERERYWVVHRARPCVLRFRAEDHFILGGRHSRVSKHHSESVRSEICFKEIVSNTRLDLNCSSFHAFGLWVFNCLQISIYIYSVFINCIYLSHLFVLFLILCIVLFTLS